MKFNDGGLPLAWDCDIRDNISFCSVGSNKQVPFVSFIPRFFALFCLEGSSFADLFPLILSNALLWCCIFLFLKRLQGLSDDEYDRKWPQKHFETCWEATRPMARMSARFYGLFSKKRAKKFLSIRIVSGYSVPHKYGWVSGSREYPDTQCLFFWKGKRWRSA